MTVIVTLINFSPNTTRRRFAWCLYFILAHTYFVGYSFEQVDGIIIELCVNKYVIVTRIVSKQFSFTLDVYSTHNRIFWIGVETCFDLSVLYDHRCCVKTSLKSRIAQSDCLNILELHKSMKCTSTVNIYGINFG